MEELKIVKIGGNVIDDEEDLVSFLKDFQQLNGPKLLVHGGGKKASEISKKLGIAPLKVDGRRITDKPTLEIVAMVYAGSINKTIVAILQKFGCNALGLSGADANVIEAVKRPVEKIDYGFAGDITAEGINTNFLRQLLALNISPVLCAITHDGNGQLLNTNADTIATVTAKSMSMYYDCKLTYCFEKDGVLTDANDDTSCLSTLNFSEFQQYLTSKIITDGMIPKLSNAFEALKAGVSLVEIKNAKNILQKSGTQITLV